MKKVYSVIVLLIFLAILSFYTNANALPDHPRIWISGGKLDILKSRMSANTKQWQNLYNWCNSKQPIGGGSIYSPNTHFVNFPLAYKVTNDSKYADAAIYWMDKIKNYTYKPDSIHDNIICLALGFDWLYDYLTESQKTGYINNINAMVEYMKTGSYSHLYNAEFGNYSQRYMLAEAMAGYATFGDNPEAQGYLDHAMSKWIGIRDCHRLADAGGGRFEGENYGSNVWMYTLRFVELVKSVTGENLYEGETFFEDRLKFLLYALHPTTEGIWNFRNGDFKDKRMHTPRVRVQLVILAEQYYNTYGKYAYWYMNNTYKMNTNVYDFMVYGGKGYDFIWYDPDKSGVNISELPLAYDGSGDNGIGPIIMKSDWGENQTWIGFICGNWYGGGHQQLDQASFQIYSNGGELVVDSGNYDGSGDSDCMRNWSARTIAHNTMLICEPNERWDNSLRGGGWSYYANDCGQRSFDQMPQVLQTAEIWQQYQDRCRLCQVNRFITTADYDYVLSDPTMAYNNPTFRNQPDASPQNAPKISKFTRELAYLRPGSSDNEFLAIFDTVVALERTYKKTWLLHTHNQPVLNGSETVVQGSSSAGIIESTNSDLVTATHGNGKLFCKTVLPQNPKITRIGGGSMDASGYIQWLDGKNRYEWCGSNGYYGKWRVEVSPTVENTFDNFLHILYMTSSSTSTMPATTLITSGDGNMKGALILDSTPRVVMFSKDGSTQNSVTYSADYSGTGKHLLTSIQSGQYDIYKNGTKALGGVQTTSEGTLFFQLSGGGAIQIVRTGEAPPPPPEPTMTQTRTPTPTQTPQQTLTPTPQNTPTLTPTPEKTPTPTPPAAPKNLRVS